jgi:cellulose synthase/poly-beta-1,6-N-acetylglucosamine synthase-like glycosyltransferase
MRWNPIYNAVGAACYIGTVAAFMHFITSIRHDTPDTFFDGMGFLSLFVLSAAVMSFLFFYQPVSLLIENKKKEALMFFLKTLGAFGLITVCVLVFVSLR